MSVEPPEVEINSLDRLGGIELVVAVLGSKQEQTSANRLLAQA
jgi:hypothetical protein